MPKDPTIKKILLIGSGPILIGQAAEFDFSGSQACRSLREEGVSVVLVNSNPATIMMDPETADAIYIEPFCLRSSKLFAWHARRWSLMHPKLGSGDKNLMNTF